MIAGECKVGEYGRCGKLNGRRHDAKHRHKHRGYKFWAGIGSREQLPAAMACKKGHIDAGACVFAARKYPCRLLVEEPYDCRRGRAMGSVMDGLKRNVAIGPQAEHHVERSRKRDEAEAKKKNRNK